MAAMNIYNFYHMAAPKVANTKFDTHKKEELQAIYQHMVRYNQKQPFYKLSISSETQNYIIGIKEASLELKTSAAFLEEDTDSSNRPMTVYTDQPSSLSVQMLDSASPAADIAIEVDQIATPQKNTGTMVSSSGTGIEPGKHFLTIERNGTEYQFELNTKAGETNLSIQRRLADSINHSNIGVQAAILESGTSSALNLTSAVSGTGSSENGLQFLVKGISVASLSDYFGLNHVTTMPANAMFSLNGIRQQAASNQISINNTIGIELLRPTKQAATVHVTPDSSSLLNDVDDFVDSYNLLMDLAHQTQSNPNGSKKLLRELSTVTRRFRNELESTGLTLDDQGYLKKDEALLTQSTENGQFQELFHHLSAFKHAIDSAASRVTSNPMEYVDKTIISYPNTKRNFPNPYMPSIYSGMLYNRYL